MKIWICIIVAATVILSGCNSGMDAPPQVKVDDGFEIDVPLMESVVQQPQPPAGVAPMIGLVDSPSTPPNINLSIGMIGLSVINPNFQGEGSARTPDPTRDDFVAYLQASAIPRTSIKVQWFVNDVIIQEDEVALPNNEPWPIYGHWKDAFSGDHRLKIIIDPDNSIPESNEEDNEYTAPFSIPD